MSIPPNHQPEHNLGSVVLLNQLVARLADIVAAEDECAAQDFGENLGVNGRDALKISFHDSDDTQLGGEV